MQKYFIEFFLFTKFYSIYVSKKRTAMKTKIKINNKYTAGFCLTEDCLIHLRKLKMSLGTSMSQIVELSILSMTPDKLKTLYLASVQDRMKSVEDIEPAINPKVEVQKEILTSKQKYNRAYYAKKKKLIKTLQTS